MDLLFLYKDTIMNMCRHQRQVSPGKRQEHESDVQEGSYLKGAHLFTTLE